MTDEEIDYSDIPPLTEAFFERAQLWLPNAIELDPDVLAWFKNQGRDYPERINQAVREYIALHEQ
jgi:uncharacterized protein (DUF4415 family)